MSDPATSDDEADEAGEGIADEPDRSSHGWDDTDRPDEDLSGATESADSKPNPNAVDESSPDSDGAGERGSIDQRTDTGAGDDAGLGRRQLFGLAILVVGVALFVVPAPGVLEMETHLLIAVVATGALILGLVYAGDERVTSYRFWRPPEPEPGSEIPRPGASFERLSGSALDERIRAVAIDTLTDATRCSEEAAQSRLASGAWTNDRLAAAALSDEVRPRFRRRFRARLTGEDLDRRARERALAELAAIRTGRRGLEPADDADVDGGTDRDDAGAGRLDAAGTRGGWGSERDDRAADQEVIDP